MAFQVSPGINVSEIDLTTSVPAVSVSTGAVIGEYQWGPVNVPTLISSEVQLVYTFGKPTVYDASIADSFFAAANFLSYSNSLYVVRAGNTTSQLNAVSPNSATAFAIQNDEYFVANFYQSTNATCTWASRYPGELGNTIQVIAFSNPNTTIWGDLTSNTSNSIYNFATQFDRVPSTTPYVQNVTGSSTANDEMHILVVDIGGRFTGTQGSVLEKYQGLSKLRDAKSPDGSSNYFRDVIYRKSKYVHTLNYPSDNRQNWGNTVAQLQASGVGFVTTESSNTAYFGKGTGASSPNDTDWLSAIDQVSDKQKLDISLLITGNVDSTVQNYAITKAAARTDCVAFVSPPFAAVTDSTNPAQKVVDWATNSGSYTGTGISGMSSYAVADSGWKYQYDKYNDIYRWSPLNADIAGLCARTDSLRDPWFSPAGLTRGGILNCVKLAFNPNQAQRDLIYKNGVNPVISSPGEGAILFGDKTLQNRASAFDRINVRRLFIVLEKAITKASRSSLFEFNDAFTRSQFVALVDPFLRTVQGRRGIYNYKIVCDESNNPPAIIDQNQFVGDIYIQSAKSVNFIQLNFVATRTGVDFSQVVGQF